MFMFTRHSYAAAGAISELEPKISPSVGNWQVKKSQESRIKEVH